MGDESLSYLFALCFPSEEVISGLASCETFTDVAEFLKLNKRKDFRHSNLRGLDFSFADLRGFDFTGADLSDCYGAGIIFDETTIFDFADVTGSCFAMHVRHAEMFNERPQLEKLYSRLKDGETYEVSEWIHHGFSKKSRGKPQFAQLDDLAMSVLCQRLLLDDIDLTKRADLFYHLNSICGSEAGLKEMLLAIIATHMSNEIVANKFIRVAGRLYSNDPIIADSLMRLCDDPRENVRLTSFEALSGTLFFVQNLRELQRKFKLDINSPIRRRLLLKSALSLGRSHVDAIRSEFTEDEYLVENILDIDQILELSHAESISRRIRNRQIGNMRRVDGDEALISQTKNPGTEEIQNILNLQEEVISVARVWRDFYIIDTPIGYKNAKDRIERRKLGWDRTLELKEKWVRRR